MKLCDQCQDASGEIKCDLCGGYFCDKCVVEDLSGNIVCIDCWKREV